VCVYTQYITFDFGTNTKKKKTIWQVRIIYIQTGCKRTNSHSVNEEECTCFSLQLVFFADGPS